MTLKAGDNTAPEGTMAHAIYDKLSSEMEEGIELTEDELKPVREKWRKLSYAIAHGVIEHLKSNMVIKDIQTEGTVTTSVSGSTGGTSIPIDATHTHSVSLSGQSANVIFDQVVGTGTVE